jgi:type I site-specific restriction endonuclease
MPRVSIPMLTSLGAHCMEAAAQPPTTFRLTPRPYQYEAVAALLAATARGVQRPLLVLPTGTGKTIVFALLVQRVVYPQPAANSAACNSGRIPLFHHLWEGVLP